MRLVLEEGEKVYVFNHDGKVLLSVLFCVLVRVETMLDAPVVNEENHGQNEIENVQQRLNLKELVIGEPGLRPERQQKETLERTVLGIGLAIMGVRVGEELKAKAKEDSQKEVDNGHLNEVEEEDCV